MYYRRVVEAGVLDAATFFPQVAGRISNLAPPLLHVCRSGTTDVDLDQGSSSV